MIDPYLSQIILYYITVGFVMNLTGVLITMQDHRVRLDVVMFIVHIFLWPLNLFKLIKGALQP